MQPGARSPRRVVNCALDGRQAARIHVSRVNPKADWCESCRQWRALVDVAFRDDPPAVYEVCLDCADVVDS
jgi:hypothetical protein